MQWALKINVSRMVFLILISVISISRSMVILYAGFSYFIEWELVSLNRTSIVGACILD